MLLRPFPLLFAALALTMSPARADAVTDAAFADAIAMFEAARPQLGTNVDGVDVAVYRDALTLRRFTSSHWGGTVELDVVRASEASGSCSRFAAYALIPPKGGRIDLVLCPKFFGEGSEALRSLTILHELVHVVSGPDECRAMAVAARIELAATGQWTRVDRYWAANGCAGSAFRLP